jgi:glycosyltransferase involved in cell wall biosynthesis
LKTLAVLLPTYNAAHFLNEAIDSILEQTFTDFDLYVIDDCSTDNTKVIVDSYSDSRINYIKNNENLGIAATLNKGIKMLAPHYEFIARMDADDWNFSDRFEKQVAFLKSSLDLIMCGTQGYWLKGFQDQIQSPWKYPLSHEEIKYQLLFSACFGHSSIMFRSELLNNNEITYNESIKTCEDWDLWTRIIHIGKVANLPDFLMKYRIVGTSNHRSEENRNKHLKECSKVIANHWNSFNIECDEVFIYNVYFSENQKSKAELKSDILKLISISNKLCLCASNELNDSQLDRLKYRLLRNLKRTWKLSKVSIFSIGIWMLIFKNVTFSGVFNTLKTVVK